MPHTSRFVLASLLVFISLVTGHQVHAALLEVPDSYPGIQLALDASASGDTVLVAPGHYHERLVIPNRDLTLASHTLLNGDTLFISQTVLDGDSLGSIITAEEGGQHRFVLDGFTLQRGVGYQEHGGAIHMTDSSSVVLRNLYFTRNTTTNWHGSCIYLSGISNPFRGTQRAEMKHIRGWSNVASDPVQYKIFVLTRHTVIIEDVVFPNSDSNMMAVVSFGDTCIVKNAHTYSSQCHGTIVAGITDATAESYQLYEDISVRDCQWRNSSLVNLAGHAPARVSNVYLEDNEFVGDREGSGVMLSTSFVGSAEFDSLVFARNKGVVQCATGGYFELWRSQPLLEPVHGRIRNLVLTDNVLGDSTYTDWNGNNRPSMIVTRGYSLENAVLRNNTNILTPGPETPVWGVNDANLLLMGVMQMDSFFLRNALFENNLVIDLDDYDAMGGDHWANDARCLYIGPQVYGSFHVDNVVFDGNLQPNMCPEVPYGGLYDDPVDMGAVMMVDGYNVIGIPEKYFSNIVFRDNQDGGFRASKEHDLRLRNITMINMQRQALDLEAERVELDNVLIDGCEPYEAISFRSEQMPLRLRVTEPSIVRNCTVINSTTPYVVMAGLREPGMSTAPIVRFENCLFANNQYDRFAALIPNYTDTPGWDPYIDGEFNYCLLPEAPVHGSNNLIGLDPLFEEVWGVPYLDPASPCIDAGNPVSIYNDAEDPENPGWARWPSQGSVRADIGVTGGPLAAAIDTNWVSVRDAASSTTRPAGFELGEPFPNPFNPVTRIPYLLHRPTYVQVRVYSLLGRLLIDQKLGTLPSGQHVVSVDGSRWATGVYLVEFLAGEERDVKKVMLLK